MASAGCADRVHVAQELCMTLGQSGIYGLSVAIGTVNMCQMCMCMY